MMQSAFMLFASLGIGYLLCILARKEKGNLRILGYTLGISVLVLALLYGLMGAYSKHCFMMSKKGMICDKMMKKCAMMKKVCP